MARSVGIGLAQIGSPPGDADANRQRSVHAAKELFEDGANLVVLPELTVPWYSSNRDELISVAEPITGLTIEAWRGLAADHDGVVVGGFCERSGDALYNTAVAVDAGGVVGHYRKLHLFSEEKLCFEPGDLGLSVVDTAFGRLGICVCYDLRFVEVVRALALMGADIICVPTAWISGFDQAQWDDEGLCPQAHGGILQANLSQVFLACASQVGTYDPHVFLGSSIVVDPYGERLLGPLPGRADQLDVAVVDLDDVSRAHTRGPLIQPRADRRADVYRLVVGDSEL